MIAAAALVLAMAGGFIAILWLIRLLLGPGPLDRIGAAFAFGQSAVVVLGALSVALARSQWLDTAFGLMLGGFALAIMALKLARYRSLQLRLSQTSPEKASAS